MAGGLFGRFVRRGGSGCPEGGFVWGRTPGAYDDFGRSSPRWGLCGLMLAGARVGAGSAETRPEVCGVGRELGTGVVAVRGSGVRGCGG